MVKIIEEGEIEDAKVGKNAMNFDVLFVNTKMVFITFILTINIMYQNSNKK